VVQRGGGGGAACAPRPPAPRHPRRAPRRYAGWGPGQLQDECKRGVWFPAAASADLLLSGDAKGGEVWHRLLRLMGGEFASLSESVQEAERAARGSKAAGGKEAGEGGR
jgi:hypothetical protein